MYSNGRFEKETKVNVTKAYIVTCMLRTVSQHFLNVLIRYMHMHVCKYSIVLTVSVDMSNNIF